jgi:DNA repair protein RecN (Recombination protein N)
MLRELAIRNFAIIDDLTIEFSDGLSILSGETGAGKSIIVNAVNLLLGSRATTKLIRTGEASAELEACFRVAPGSHTARIMTAHELDAGDELIIRRLISRSDRHRIYINGRMATMQTLTEITENLASISGQHAHQGLLKEEQHLLILDQFGALMPLRNKVREAYLALQPLLSRLDKLTAAKQHQAEQLELTRFQRDEIKSATVVIGEDEALEKDKQRLKNAVLLFQIVQSSIDNLYANQGAVVEQLGEIHKNLARAADLDGDLAAAAESVGEVTYRIEDITQELRTYIDGLQVDDQQLDQVDERLALLNRLKRKFGGSLQAVVNHLQSLEQALLKIENIDQQIDQLRARLDGQHLQLTALATELSSKRQQAAKRLAKQVEKELGSLKMDNTRFQVALSPLIAAKDQNPYLCVNGAGVSESGIDKASFLISPNVGEALKPMTAIASGGELSRVVLALKAILAQTEEHQSIVFDEVDAGIGGAMAEVVGVKLCQLARHHQVICITHLSQIAKFAHRHFRISKSVVGGRTITRITVLNQQQRIEEIARMLGGVDITPTTLAHARELLKA